MKIQEIYLDRPLEIWLKWRKADFLKEYFPLDSGYNFTSNHNLLIGGFELKKCWLNLDLRRRHQFIIYASLHGPACSAHAPAAIRTSLNRSESYVFCANLHLTMHPLSM